MLGTAGPALKTRPQLLLGQMGPRRPTGPSGRSGPEGRNRPPLSYDGVKAAARRDQRTLDSAPHPPAPPGLAGGAIGAWGRRPFWVRRAAFIAATRPSAATADRPSRRRPILVR